MAQTILIVDDEPDIRMTIETRLTANGYQVITAEDGEEGLKKMQESTVDLAIIDIYMPKMDGYAFYKELKKDKKTASIPILILSARSQLEGPFRAVGADSFLAKPFEAKDLLGQVARLLSRPTSTPRF